MGASRSRGRDSRRNEGMIETLSEVQCTWHAHGSRASLRTISEEFRRPG